MGAAEQQTAETSHQAIDEETGTVTTPAANPNAKLPARKKAKQLARHLRAERPDYAYLK